MATQTAHGIRLSALCPKFLHTNSTSHTWPFSAIAELIDNAYDPDVNAKQIWIDKTVMSFQVCLTFTDNGNGMTPDKLHKMLSFGFSDKVAVNGHVPVGLYGNGFKSGSMRLGKDAIVFTKNESGMHVGMLSQSYLEAIHAEHVVVPIISFNKHNRLVNTEDSEANLKAILAHSLLSSEKELLAELDAILGKKGTRIIIWNLRRDKNKFLEFDFDKDKYDIKIPDEIDGTLKRGYKKMERADQVAPDSDYSLRAYCSILYLKPRMQIILRGQKVQTQLVCKSLAHIEKDVYRPKFLAPKTVTITFGYNCRNKEHYGIMMYHKNRLIKAYVRVGCQLKANNMGVGVVGVIQCNFLKPTHNKQDFDYTNDYRLTLTALGEKLNDYWNEMTMKKNLDSTSVPVEDTQKSPDQTWVQCDSCLKWRKLPDAMGKLPVKWYCYMNADPQFRDCNVPEEPEDDDEITHSTYEKTYKRRKSEQLQQINEKATIIFTPPNKDLQPALNSCARLLNKLSSFPARSSEIVSDSFYPDYRNKRLLARDSPPISAKKLKAETIELTDEVDEIEDGDVIILEDSSTPKPISESEACENDWNASPVHEERTEHRPPIESSVSDVSAVATQTEGARLTVKKEEDVSATEFPEDHQPFAHCNGSGTHREPENLCNPPSPACANHHERETYRKYCGSLEQKVKDLQNQLVEMKNNSVKKEVYHKLTQTGDCLFGKSENAPKQLVAQYEQALKEIDRLKLRCGALLRSKSEQSAGPPGDGNARADDLARQLGVCSTERDQYKLEVEKLNEEKAQLTLQNNQLKSEVQQLKLMVQDMNKNNPAWTSSLGEESLKLRILRMNVAGLLTTLMPELDLQQTDYGFDAVDDILVQVLEQTEKQANGHE